MQTQIYIYIIVGSFVTVCVFGLALYHAYLLRVRPIVNPIVLSVSDEQMRRECNIV